MVSTVREAGEKSGHRSGGGGDARHGGGAAAGAGAGVVAGPVAGLAVGQGIGDFVERLADKGEASGIGGGGVGREEFGERFAERLLGFGRQGFELAGGGRIERPEHGLDDDRLLAAFGGFGGVVEFGGSEALGVEAQRDLLGAGLDGGGDVAQVAAFDQFDEPPPLGVGVSWWRRTIRRWPDSRR